MTDNSDSKELRPRHAVVAIVAAIIHATGRLGSIVGAVKEAESIVEHALHGAADVLDATAGALGDVASAIHLHKDAAGADIAQSASGSTSAGASATPVQSSGAHNVSDAISALGQGQPVEHGKSASDGADLSPVGG